MIIPLRCAFLESVYSQMLEWYYIIIGISKRSIAIYLESFYQEFIKKMS